MPILQKRTVKTSRVGFSRENLQRLIDAIKDDSKLIDMLLDCLQSFEEYHRSVYEMEMKLKIYSHGNMDRAEYQDMRQNLDLSRTLKHNAMLNNISIINRLVDKAGTPPVYEGVVSEEIPYRRDAADAVLAYVKRVIKDRR